MNVVVYRNEQNPQSTYGLCTVYDDNKKPIFTSYCIENTKFLIAEGEYDGKWTKSPRFSREATAKAKKKDPNALPVEVWTWEIFGVLDGTRKRAGLRVHPVNFAKDLLGCVALGEVRVDLNKDGNLDIGKSKIAVDKFNEVTKGTKTMKFKLVNAFAGQVT